MPSLFHLDPRYFRIGRGTVTHRLGYAVTRIFVSRTDKGGPDFNASEWLGNAAATAISNAYYPDTRTASDNIERLGIACATGAFSQVMKEFVAAGCETRQAASGWHDTTDAPLSANHTRPGSKAFVEHGFVAILVLINLETGQPACALPAAVSKRGLFRSRDLGLQFQMTLGNTPACVSLIQRYGGGHLDALDSKARRSQLTGEGHREASQRARRPATPPDSCPRHFQSAWKTNMRIGKHAAGGGYGTLPLFKVALPDGDAFLFMNPPLDQSNGCAALRDRSGELPLHVQLRPHKPRRADLLAQGAVAHDLAGRAQFLRGGAAADRGGSSRRGPCRSSADTRISPAAATSISTSQKLALRSSGLRAPASRGISMACRPPRSTARTHRSAANGRAGSSSGKSGQQIAQAVQRPLPIRSSGSAKRRSPACRAAAARARAPRPCR